MYELKFEHGNGQIVKVAKTDKDVLRLLTVYTNLSQQERKILYQKIITNNGNL